MNKSILIVIGLLLLAAGYYLTSHFLNQDDVIFESGLDNETAAQSADTGSFETDASGGQQNTATRPVSQVNQSGQAKDENWLYNGQTPVVDVIDNLETLADKGDPDAMFRLYDIFTKCLLAPVSAETLEQQLLAMEGNENAAQLQRLFPGYGSSADAVIDLHELCDGYQRDRYDLETVNG